MSFDSCEICGANEWSEVYSGAVRDGVFGSSRKQASVARCAGCGVDRLAEECATPESVYETAAYRKKLQQGLDSESYFQLHDELQIHTLQALWPNSLRGAVVADIGCAGGSLLDHLQGVSAVQVAIEPSDVFRESLTQRGYRVYPYARAASRDWSGQINHAFSIQVIGHVRNPLFFLKEIRELLAPDSRLVISTPNRNDILMALLPDDFPEFFYRTVHRWYFDAKSLADCARRAGFDVVETRFVHRYGMANAIAWLRDRRPTGQSRIDAIGPLADDLWRGYLEQSGQADCIYMTLQPSARNDSQ
jgi:SAM-dependent methyltransferase